jgi:hypothetical protein
MPWLALFPALLAAAAMAGGADERVLALFALPAMLWLPGRGFAARWTRDPLARLVGAFWISALFCVLAVRVGAWTGLGAGGALATAATLTAIGERLPRRPAAALAPAVRMAVAAVFVCVAALGVTWWDTVRRPLEAHWWFPKAEQAWEDGRETTLPRIGTGWRERRRVGWEDAQALRLTPRMDAPFLLGPAEGPLVVAVRGPVGATLEVEGRRAVVTADVTETADEGAVPRYLERGVAAVALDQRFSAGEKLTLRLGDPSRSTVYVLGSAEAVWALHAEGELRFVHYYQLLNMVEQVRWARELWAERRVTDVQPPLPSYVLAAPLAVTGGELPTINLIFLMEVALVGVAGVAALAAWAPGAPTVAWLLPAAACAMHGKLMLEPASTMLPDTLFTLAVVGALGALPHGRSFGVLGLLAQLCRYPGAFVVFVAGVLAGETRRAVRMLALVLLVAAGFGAWGAATGQLQGWLDTVWWETGPEHWHGEHDPAVLLGRAPRFYAIWLAYAGGLPLLAALRWPRGTRVLLGTALIYSLVLCTVDHTPSHYFLPLLHLSAVAAGVTAGALTHPLARLAVPALGLVGIFVAYNYVPVTG